MIPEDDRAIDGQIYRFGGREPYTRIDGVETEIQVWHSHCARCGTPIVAKISLSAQKFEPVRRCEAHRRPGRKPKRIAKPIDGEAS